MSTESRGRMRIDLAASRMPVFESACTAASQSGAFLNESVGVAVHITSETAVLVEGLLKAGARHVALCSSNWRTADHEICEALATNNAVSIHGLDVQENEHESSFSSVLKTKPSYLIDDGAELIKLSHEINELKGKVRGALEETTSGVRRVLALQDNGRLMFPVVAINSARTKHYFDNRYGTGQSAVDAVMRVSNSLFAGATIVVIGYGRCGKGIARAAAGLGGHVAVAEIDPVAALEAHYDGFSVGKAVDLCADADVVFTATGSRYVIDSEIWESVQDGAMIVNCGHFRNEVNMEYVEDRCTKMQVRPSLFRYEWNDGRRTYIVSEGNIANLAAAEGNPATLIDMSFANQLLGLEWLAKMGSSLAEPRLVTLPREIDDWVARSKLEAHGVCIDQLSVEQESFNRSFD